MKITEKGFQVIPSYCIAHYFTLDKPATIITGRTHIKQGGFCLETGVELPRELNLHFLVNENGDLLFFSLLLKWAVTFFLLNKLRLICTVERETTVGNVFKAFTHKYNHSLRNRTTGRRGRQIACAWRTWQGYNLGVLSWSWLTSMFSGLLQKDLFKRKGSLTKSYLKQNYCHACHTRFAVSFPLPSRCVNRDLKMRRRRRKRERHKSNRFN